MVCLGFKLGPQEGRHRQNHGAMADAQHTANFYSQYLNVLILYLVLDLKLEPLNYESPPVTSRPGIDQTKKAMVRSF